MVFKTAAISEYSLLNQTPNFKWSTLTFVSYKRAGFAIRNLELLDNII